MKSPMTSALTSALTPAGPIAQAIADLWWLMFVVLGCIFIIVMALLFMGIARPKSDRPRPPLGDNKFIVLGGLALPAIVLMALLIYTLILTSGLRIPKTTLTVQLTGHMWWWDVRYPDHGIVTANEIYIPVGQPVRIEMRSEDVIHSLWVPSLSGKTDLLPGLTTVHWFEAARPGTYRGQCAEFCGLQHARMSLYVVALEPEEFIAWLDSKKAPVVIPKDPNLVQGFAAFMSVGCAECHTIRGTYASGDIGPDLTHIGSRLSLGAGTLPSNHGNLAGWVANPQAIKPGSKMPALFLEPDRFHALISYLMSLK